MIGYVLRRLGVAVVTVFLAASLVFGALLLLPGDPAEIILGMGANPNTVASLRQRLGLDMPVGVRYGRWLGGALRGDLGMSLGYQRSVMALVRERLAVSFVLTLTSMVLALIIAVPLGIIAALQQGTWFAIVVSTIAQLGVAVPAFWLGFVLIYVFGVRLGWVPVATYVPWQQSRVGMMKSLLLPTVALGLGQAAIITRMVRATLLKVLAQAYVNTAKAKGLAGQTVLFKHALRNASVVLVTVIGSSMANILINAVVIEKVFSLPGMGSLLLTAVGRRDFPLVQGQLFIYSSIVIILNFLVDVSYGVLDPRLRYD